jgi:hypothetical protein
MTNGKRAEREKTDRIYKILRIPEIGLIPLILSAFHSSLRLHIRAIRVIRGKDSVRGPQIYGGRLTADYSDDTD